MILQFPKPSRDSLIEAHMHLVPVIARTVKAKLPPSFEFDDLVSEGYLGLIRAVDQWDAERGPLEPRARYVILMTILQSVRRKRYTENTLVSLDQPLQGSDDLTLLDVLRAAEVDRVPYREFEDALIASIDERRRKSILRGAVGGITPRARRVVEIYYFEKGDMTVAAEELGVQSSRASQIHHDGLRELSRELGRRGVSVPYESLRARPKAA